MNNQYEQYESIVHPLDDEDIPRNRAMLPKIYRLVKLDCKKSDENFRYVATLYHAHVSMRVTWTAHWQNPRMIVGSLVSIRWCGNVICELNAIRVSRIVPMECPEHWVNLFHTVPCEWTQNRRLIAEAAKMVNLMPTSSRFIFNCNNWDGNQFMELCKSQKLADLIATLTE